MAGEWLYYKVGDLFDLKPGYAFKSAEFVESGVPVIKIKNVKAGTVVLDDLSYVDERFLHTKKDYIVSYGDILITMSGNRFDGSRETWVGKVAQYLFSKPHLLNQRVAILKPKIGHKLDRRCCSYILGSGEYQDLFISIATSSGGQANLSPAQILGEGILLPPYDEQRAIAHILGTLDDKIELNRRMNETLEAMGRALFKSWFVDFDPVRAKAEGRNPGLPKPLADLFPDSLGDSELGEIPKGWQVKVLNDMLSELETGGRPKGGVSGYATGTPSVGAESIVGLGVFDYSKTKYVPDEFFKKMTKGRIKSRDVLLYKDGGRPGAFEPHVTLFGDGFPFETCAINEHVYRMRVKQEIGQNFLFFWLSSDAVMEEMRIKGTGVAIPGLNSTQVKSLTMLVPTIRVAKAFDALVDLWITRILANCNESRILSAVRDTLLPKLISGELRVRNVEKVVESVA